MWLLNTTTGELKWFAKRPIEGYLILSHVWTAEEQSFQDLQALKTAGGLSAASPKIYDCCAFARRRGYSWAWIDTCCIDKTSSAELSEAINSMFAWYRDADECIAFLQDVDETEDPYVKGSQFRRSKWYTRGWTLQELIAPRRLIFVSKNWRIIGTKATLAGLVEEITNVDFDVLTFRRTHIRVSVARRMSWAANRQTTREEDRAYSLLGIFGVSIATVYGEGDNAFIRLQEEIMKHIPDQSIFAWGPPMLRDVGAFSRTISLPGKRHRRALLSISPDSFADSSEVVPIPPETVSKRLGIKVPPLHFALTSYGMHAWVPMMKAPGCPSDKPVWLAVLACADGTDNLVALILQPQSEDSVGRFFVGVTVFVAQQVDTGAIHCDDYRTVALDLAPARAFPWRSSSAKMREVHIPHRLDTINFDYAHEEKRPPRDKRRWSDMFTAPCELALPAWHVQKLLRERGFAMTAPDPGDSSLFFQDAHYEPQEIHLAHADSGDVIVVRIVPCSTDGECDCSCLSPNFALILNVPPRSFPIPPCIGLAVRLQRAARCHTRCAPQCRLCLRTRIEMGSIHKALRPRAVASDPRLRDAQLAVPRARRPKPPRPLSILPPRADRPLRCPCTPHRWLRDDNRRARPSWVVAVVYCSLS